jgi:hypothetical protein
MSDDEVDPLMTIAWRDFLSAVLEMPDLRKAFVADTGRRFDDEDGVKHFAFWATSTQWGVLGVPLAFLGEMQAAGYALPRLPADGAGG